MQASTIVELTENVAAAKTIEGERASRPLVILVINDNVGYYD